MANLTLGMAVKKQSRSGVLSHAVMTGQIHDGGTSLVLFEDGNDVLFGKSLALHGWTSQGSNYREIQPHLWYQLRVTGHWVFTGE